MPAFVIVDITIHDESDYEEYKKLTPATLAAFDGRFVVRGGKSEILEGSWLPQRTVVLEFPTVASAKDWWASDLYARPKMIRQRSAYTNMIVVEGV